MNTLTKAQLSNSRQQRTTNGCYGEIQRDTGLGRHFIEQHLCQVGQHHHILISCGIDNCIDVTRRHVEGALMQRKLTQLTSR